MVNLLEETLEIIKENGKIVEDIKFVSANYSIYSNGKRTYYEYYMTWDDFVSLSNVEYDDGYGSNTVKMGLKVVGKN